jgi:hypothetical protein
MSCQGKLHPTYLQKILAILPLYLLCKLRALVRLPHSLRVSPADKSSILLLNAFVLL